MDDSCNPLDQHARTLANAKRLMSVMEELFPNPAEALFASVLVVATIASGLEMPLEHLLDGIRAAHSDLEKQDDTTH